MNIEQIVVSVTLSLLLLSGEFCGAAPPMSQYLSDSDELTDQESAQNLMVEQELRRQLLRNWAQESENDNGSYGVGDLNRTGFRRIISQKRGGLQKQTRTNRGGVALCLWKVCPAGPWLVAKK